MEISDYKKMRSSKVYFRYNFMKLGRLIIVWYAEHKKQWCFSIYLDDKPKNALCTKELFDLRKLIQGKWLTDKTPI